MTGERCGRPMMIYLQITFNGAGAGAGRRPVGFAIFLVAVQMGRTGLLSDRSGAAGSRDHPIAPLILIYTPTYAGRAADLRLPPWWAFFPILFLTYGAGPEEAWNQQSAQPLRSIRARLALADAAHILKLPAHRAALFSWRACGIGGGSCD